MYIINKTYICHKYPQGWFSAAGSVARIASYFLSNSLVDFFHFRAIFVTIGVIFCIMIGVVFWFKRRVERIIEA